MKRWSNLLALAGLLLLSAGTTDPPPLSLEPPQALLSFVEGNNTFAFELYAKLGKDHRNLVLSPLSLSTALAVAHAGARGRTEGQIARTAHFPTNQTRLRTEMTLVRGELARIGQSGHVQLGFATGLWAQQDYGFEGPYLDLVRKHYDAGVEFVDFVSAERGAAQKIDTWITRQTQGRITGALPADTVTRETRLVIANAVYFKGDWASRFSRSGTRKQPFRVSATASVDVPMMRQEHEFLYAEADGVQLVELPYVGRDLSMIVLLPKEPDGMQELEKKLDVSHLAAWRRDLERCRVDLELPRFNLTSRLSLRDTLQTLGITDAFDTQADFTGMTRRRPLFIQEVEQSSVVEVNEEGTEAASATAMSFGCARSAIEPPRRVFHADHPFVFFIRADQTGTILFLGRVVDPNQ